MEISSLRLISRDAWPRFNPWISLTVDILKLYCRYCRLLFCCSIIFSFYIILAFTRALIISFYLSFCKLSFLWQEARSILSGVFLKSFNRDCGSVFTCLFSISFFFAVFFFAWTGLSLSFSRIFFRFSLFCVEEVKCSGLFSVLTLRVWVSLLIVLVLLDGSFSVSMLYYGFECI